MESRRRRISSCLLIVFFVGVVCARTIPAIGQGSVQLRSLQATLEWRSTE
jgi:hypothetical protein